MIVHPMSQMSYDEQNGRGLCDIQDPKAPLPSVCSSCRQKSSFRNPMIMVPIDRNPTVLAKAYLYRAICSECQERKARRR